MIAGPLPFAVMLLTLPLVQVGTVRVGMRLVPADILALLLLIWVAANDSEGRRAILRHPVSAAAAAAAVGLFATACIASLVSIWWITPANFQQWLLFEEVIRWLGTPSERTIVENIRLLQCVAAFLVTLAFARTAERVSDAATAYVVGATAAAFYGLYVWVVMIAELPLPVLPGTFSYLHLKRAAATFPEPVAFGGYALTGIALTVWLMERRRDCRWLAGAFTVQLFAALASLSTLLIVGVAVLWTVSVLGRRLRIAASLTVVAMVTVIILFMMVPQATIIRAVEKPLTGSASWVDRLTAWRTASAMAAEYPALGVGTGLYAYNQAPFFPSAQLQNAGGRVNSIALEIAAESGLAGLACAGIILLAAWFGSARGGHGAAGLRGVAVLAVLGAGYYTSRYAFLWVFTALLIASGTSILHGKPAKSGATDCAC